MHSCDISFFVGDYFEDFCTLQMCANVDAATNRNQEHVIIGLDKHAGANLQEASNACRD